TPPEPPGRASPRPPIDASSQNPLPPKPIRQISARQRVPPNHLGHPSRLLNQRRHRQVNRPVRQQLVRHLIRVHHNLPSSHCVLMLRKKGGQGKGKPPNP